MTKMCNKCKIEQEETNFHIRLNKIRGICKKCLSLQEKERSKRPEVKERKRKYLKEYKKRNREKIYVINNRWRTNNRKTVNAAAKRRRDKDKSKYNAAIKKYRNIPEVKQKIKKYQSNYRKKLWRENINYRIRNNIVNRIINLLKEKKCKKTNKTVELIGCQVDILIRHIELGWKEKMTWDNYGRKGNRWTIDHILPVELFNLTDVNQQKVCFNYKNLQPLWYLENLEKSDILPNGKRARHLNKEEKLEYLKLLGYNF